MPSRNAFNWKKKTYCPQMPQAAMQVVKADFFGPIQSLTRRLNEYLTK